MIKTKSLSSHDELDTCRTSLVSPKQSVLRGLYKVYLF